MAALFPGREQADKASEAFEEENRPDRPDEALRFRLLQMEDENKRIPPDALLKAKAHVETMQAAQQQRAAAKGHPEGMEVARLIPSDWKWLGPGNVGGRIRAIAIHPTNPNSIWVGSVGGGIWHSTDAGNAWQPVNDFMASLSISSLVIDPTNPNTMYAGTGELFAAGNPDGLGFTPDGLRGLGVFKSADGGVTWSQLASTNPADPAVCAAAGPACPWSYVNRLAISPDGATLLAATGLGIWRSTDAGASWAVGTNTAAVLYYDVDFDPSNSQRAIAAGLGVSRYSINGGQTWSSATFSPALAAARVETAYAPSASATTYAAVDANNGDVYQSLNGGSSYTRVNTGTKFFLGAGDQGFYDNIIWVNPLDSNFVIVGGIDLWRSTDGGLNFTQISRWQCGSGQPDNGCPDKSAHADQHMIVAAPGFNNTTNKNVYFGCDGGVFRADDVATVGMQNGWTNLNRNLGITQFYSGAAGPAGTLIGGTQDNGNVRNVPQPSPSPAAYNPQGWTTPKGAAGDGGYVAVDPADPNFLYVEYVNLKMSRSTNGGANFSVISSGIPDANCTPPPGSTTCTPPANFVAPFILDPNNAGRMLAGGLSLWRSDDVKTAATPTWTAIKAASPTNTPISAIAVADGNSQLIVVGHNNGEVFRTINGTDPSPTWTRIDTGLPDRFVTRLAIDATKSPNWIYAALGGFSPDNVYVTKDLGASWTDITGTGTTGLPDVPVRSIAINPVRPDLLYVGTEVGIFASEDAGATWQLPQGGPANVSVDELFWSQGFLMAATHGRGFYTTNKAVYIGAATCQAYQPCGPEYNCNAGDWNCGCTWTNHQTPGLQDDIVLYCPVDLRGSGYVRNLKVNSRLTMTDNASLSAAEGLANYGTISGGTITADKGIVNQGTISTSKVWARSGDIISSGTIFSSGGWGYYSGEEYPVQGNNITLTEHASLSGVGILCKGNLIVTPGASLTALSAGPSLSYYPGLFVQGNVHNDGLIDVRGEWAFSTTSQGQEPTHDLSGLGQWRAGALTLGSRFDAFYGGGATFSLSSDLVLDVVGLSAYGNYDPTTALIIASNATIKQNNHNLTINAVNMRSYGQFDLGTAALNLNIPYIKTQAIVSPGRGDGLPGFKGSGTVNLTAPGSSYLELDTRVFDPVFRVMAGTVDGVMGTEFNNNVTIDAGAILNVNRGGLRVLGNLLVNGTIGKTSAANLHSSVSFFGSTLTNNGSIKADNLEFNYTYTAVSKTQTIVGGGAWPAATLVRIGFPNAATTVALANNIAANWGSLGIWSNSSINTGAFTLTLPCSSTFDSSNPNNTGEIVGTVRKTNIGNCTGPIAFTSPYTTVRFDSGTPPSEMSVSLGIAPPAGFPSAVRRNYFINPVGGSGYSATLRLDFAPAETNGNDFNSLSLWRNNGTDWVSQGYTAKDANAYWIELSGVTQFSPWAIAACPLSLLPTSASVASGGGMGSFQVLSTGGCGWMAASNVNWITVTSGASGSGNGTVSYTVAANSGGARSGNITVTGAGSTQTFTISQSADCSGLTIDPTDVTIGSSSYDGTIAVTSTSGCEWSATSNANWILITGGASGTGNGNVTYRAFDNYGPARSGAISISGQTFTITQESGCYLYLYSTEQSFASAGGSSSVEFYTGDGCPWNVVNNTSWITITSATSGTGAATVGYTVAANSGPPRAGTFTIGDQTFTLRQGSSTPLSLVVTNVSDSGAGSLRQALLEANANFGQINTVSFNISGPVTITPLAALPTIVNSVVINGINSDGRRVVLDSSYGDAGFGLFIAVAGTDTTVRGLSFVRFSGTAIIISAERTVVENCYFGTDTAGATGLGNSAAIEIDSPNNRIGGSTSGTSNVIASSLSYGIVVYESGNVIQNNYIGTNAAGANLGNQGDGIIIYADSNLIGGTAPRTGNTIAFNGRAGVNVAYGARNAIRGNSIFSNTGLGIDVGGDGVTLNGQALLTATPGANKIDGTLDAAPNSACAIELFVNDVCNPAGYGEGRRFIGKIDLITNAGGHGTFTLALPSTVTTGNVITATATDAVGNTSEFSTCAEVTPLRIASIVRPTSGPILLQGIGVPNQQHTIEILPNLSSTAVPIAVNIMTDAEGKWQYQDTTQPRPSLRVYRLRFP